MAHARLSLLLVLDEAADNGEGVVKVDADAKLSLHLSAFFDHFLCGSMK